MSGSKIKIKIWHIDVLLYGFEGGLPINPLRTLSSQESEREPLVVFSALFATLPVLINYAKDR